MQELVKLNPQKIVLACRSQERATEAMNKIGGNNLDFIPLDLNDLNSVAEFAKVFNQKYDRLDILINNAGIVQGKEILDLNEKMASLSFKVNMECHLWLIKEFLPGMVEKNKG